MTNVRAIYASLVTLAALCIASPAAAEEMSWQDAVTSLASERSHITTCVTQLKKSGDGAAISAGATDYAAAKAGMDAVLTALARGLETGGDANAADLEPLIGQAVNKRIAFCQRVASMPSQGSGEKNIFLDVLRDTIKPLVKGAKVILGVSGAEPHRRRTITTRLEAAKWPAYSEIRSSP